MYEGIPVYWLPEYDDPISCFEQFMDHLDDHWETAPEPLEPVSCGADNGFILIGEGSCQVAFIPKIKRKDEKLNRRPEVIGVTEAEAHYMSLYVRDFNNQRVSPLLQAKRKGT